MILGFLLFTSSIVMISEFDLEPPLHRTRDIRWKNQTTLLLAATFEGVRQFRVDSETPTFSPPLYPSCIRLLAWRIGWSGTNLVVGAPIREITWKPPSLGVCGKWNDTLELNWISDLDVFQDQLLWIGADLKDNLLCPEGALAWRTDLNTGLEMKTPVHFSRDGAGSPSMNNCGIFETGLVRFLENGWFVVVPGVEPGIYLYTDTGRLNRSWDTDELGINSVCNLDLEASIGFSTDHIRRHVDWLNHRMVVDEILPLGEEIGLVVRRVEKGHTKWDLLVLSKDGAAQQMSIPIEDDSPLAHIKGDAYGNRVALVIYSFSSSSEMKSRLVVMEVNGE